MTKTEHLKLPQWDLTDQVRMKDFNEAFAAIDKDCGNCRIFAGSYVGTGEMGKEHPNRLEFPFKPMILFMNTAKNYGSCRYIIFSRPITRLNYLDATSNPFLLTWEDRAVSWYNPNSDPDKTDYQLNTLGETYHYIALGVLEK